MTDTEGGWQFAAQLDDLCEAYGLTPARALRDPDLAFNQTIRNTAGAYKLREIEREKAKAAARR